MTIYAYVDRGHNKKECEDRILIGDSILAGGYFEKEADDDLNLLIAVADGVGGNNGGAYAAGMAVDGIRILNRKEKLDASDVKNLIENVNLKILQTSAANSSVSNMATTLSGIVMNKETTILFHIGNTRIYTYKKPYLKKKTNDNTTYNTLLQSGAITEEQASNSRLKSELDACLGGGDVRYANKLLVEVQDRIGINKETIFLCSDGVHDFVSLEELEELLDVNKPYIEILKDIVHTARKNGSKDDISIIICEQSKPKFEDEADAKSEEESN